MSQPTSQGAQRLDLRRQMPETAAWVEARRQEWGAEHVNACLRRALKGEPGLFYAIEAGHVLGTPFPATHPISDWQKYAVATGSKFASFMATPSEMGAADGAH
jgi:hypothetical protein